MVTLPEVPPYAQEQAEIQQPAKKQPKRMFAATPAAAVAKSPREVEQILHMT